MKTNKEYLKEAAQRLNRLDKEDPSRIIKRGKLTMFGYVEEIAHEALNIMREENLEEMEAFLNWVLSESIDGDIHIDGPHAISILKRDKEGHPLYPSAYSSFQSLLTKFRKKKRK